MQAKIYDEFVERLAAKAKTIRIGNPCDPTMQLGPVVSARQQQRVLKLHPDRAGRRQGAPGHRRPRAARIRRSTNGFFVEPTVFADVTPRMRIFQEEVFGPFVSVSKFIDRGRRPGDWPTIRRSAWRAPSAPATWCAPTGSRPGCKCGIVWINDHHRLDPASPWGGVKDSGIGRECGTESFDQHFETKSVMLRLDDTPFDWYQNTAAQPRLN